MGPELWNCSIFENFVFLSNIDFFWIIIWIEMLVKFWRRKTKNSFKFSATFRFFTKISSLDQKIDFLIKFLFFIWKLLFLLGTLTVKTWNFHQKRSKVEFMVKKEILSKNRSDKNWDFLLKIVILVTNRNIAQYLKLFLKFFS